jgi:hypothetical protein
MFYMDQQAFKHNSERKVREIEVEKFKKIIEERDAMLKVYTDREDAIRRNRDMEWKRK